MLDFFVVFFVGRWRKTWIIYSGIVSMWGLCGALLCRSLMLVLLAKGAFKGRPRSSSICLSNRGFFVCFFFNLLGCGCAMGYLGGVEVGKQTLVRFGPWQIPFGLWFRSFFVTIYIVTFYLVGTPSFSWGVLVGVFFF